MTADCYHSIVDSLSFGLNYTSIEKTKSDKHSVVINASIVAITVVTGVWLLTDNIFILIEGNLLRPGLMALVAAFIGIAVNFLLYRSSKRSGRKLGNKNILVCAAQNKINLTASVIAFVGITLAELGQTYFDPLSAIVISFIMFNGAREIFGIEFNQTLTPGKLQIRRATLQICGILSLVVVVFIGTTTVNSMATRQNILIPAISPSENGPVSKLLSRSNYFIVYSKDYGGLWVAENPYRLYPGEVIEPFLSIIKKYDIGCIIAERIGPVVFERLDSMNILMYYDETDGSVQNAYNDYIYSNKKSIHRALASNVSKGYGRNRLNWIEPW